MKMTVVPYSKRELNQGRNTAGRMTRETERCQGEFLWKCSLNSISMKRQLTRRWRLRCMKESVLYHTLNLSRSINFSHILSSGNREAIFKTQRFSSLCQCNYVIPKGRKCKPGENKKGSLWKKRFKYKVKVKYNLK